MQIIDGDVMPLDKCVVALGNFDGLHNAHAKIINCTLTHAKKHGLLSCVLLFKNHTKAISELLTDENEKLDILRSMGVDLVYMQEFDEKFMHMSPQEFVVYLKDTLNSAAVSVGYDYRFGYKASGDVKVLQKLGAEYGIDILVTDELDYDGEAVKSTRIRELVLEGNMTDANLMLGRAYTISGDVVKGLQNGRKLGFPTVNVKYSDSKLLPRNGVYTGYTTVRGKRYKSVINIGNNPTFGADKITVESHIIDFNSDIYGENVKVEFIKRIRGEKKFQSLEALKIQIQKDMETAKGELVCT